VNLLEGWDAKSPIQGHNALGIQTCYLQRDPYEQTNVFEQRPEIVTGLRERLEMIVSEDRSRVWD